jgi:hypothetical protein
MANANHTEYNTTELKIQRQVDALASALCSCTISPEALEQKLATHHFSDAEKTCIRIAHMALCSTDCEDEKAYLALADMWDSQQGALDEAEEAAIIEAERTGDYKRVIRLQELSSLAWCSVTACECC